MFEWLFWEQYSHEPYIAVRRFQKLYLGTPDDEIDPKLKARGDQALARMQAWLEASPYLVGQTLTCADIALLAYTRMAHEGGFDLAAFPAVAAWVKRADADLGL
jgi:glutathione S-transferase